jgi:hypothetical protein
MLVYLMVIWNILRQCYIFHVHLVFFGYFGVFCSHLVHFTVIWYIFSRIGIFYKYKAGNPASLEGMIYYNSV